MYRKKHERLLTGCSVVAIWGLAGACNADAAPASAAANPSAPPEAAQAEVGEVVVTANKRVENIRNVGLTITALSAKTIADKQIHSLADVALNVPGLTFALTSTNTPVLTLRGVGFNEETFGVYSTVAVYTDEAPLSFPTLTTHAAYDLERIEVLKGPQGTLFGQNSTGGAINYIAAKPTNTFQAGADVGYGRFDQVDFDGYVSGPLTDTLRGRVALDARNSEGWQTSVTRPDDRNGATRYMAGRLLLDWTPSNETKVSININGWNDRSQPQAPQLAAVKPTIPALEDPRLATYPFPDNPRAADWNPGNPSYPDGGSPRSNSDLLQFIIRGDQSLFGNVKLTALISYVNYNLSQTTDDDGVYFTVQDFLSTKVSIKSFTPELRISDSVGRFRWVVGTNYEKSDTYEDSVVAYGQNSTSIAYDIAGNEYSTRQNMNNYAVFANTEYDLGYGLTLKAGARYTRADRTADLCAFGVAGDDRINNFFDYLAGALFPNVPNQPLQQGQCFPFTSAGVTGTPFVGKLSESNVSWKFGLDYHLNKDTLTYVNISRGYKAGSFPALTPTTQSQYTPVPQESVTAYEAGIKTDLFSRLITIDGAVFYYDYINKQIRGKTLDPTFGLLDTLITVPKSKVEGAEGDISVRPIVGLSIAGNFTYLDTEIIKYSGFDVLGGSDNFAKDPIPFAPKWALGGSLNYEWRLGNLSPFVGADVNYRSKTSATLGGERLSIADIPGVRYVSGGAKPYQIAEYATLDLRLGVKPSVGNWQLLVWAKNIANTYYINDVIAGNDLITRYSGMPATYGVTFSVTFR